mmetsp:Transcript_16088/g.40332  ORF Transcript_16088/g.40332 Transcript_16088/m.40332 type:complete len:156 (-) Transcript_16088:249-716(-)
MAYMDNKHYFINVLSISPSKQQNHPRQKCVKEKDRKDGQDSSRRNNVLTDKDCRCSRRPQKCDEQYRQLDQSRKGSEIQHFEQIDDHGRQGHRKDAIPQHADGLEKGNGSTQELGIDRDDGGSEPNSAKDGGKDQAGLSHRCLDGQQNGQSQTHH